MRILSILAVMLISLAGFAQTNSKSTISFDQVETAKNLQELFPDTYGDVDGILTYTATVAVERQPLTEVKSNSANITEEIKKLVREGHGKQVVLYFDVTRHTEDGKVKLGSIAVSVK